MSGLTVSMSSIYYNGSELVFSLLRNLELKASREIQGI